MVNPHPSRPKHGREQRFRMARRNVDNQVADPALSHGLQVIANGLHLDTIDEGSIWLQHMPSLEHEFMQAAPSLLRLQAQVA